MDVLSLRGLSKVYPGFALLDISLSLKKGRILGLIGTNDAGKTTTRKAMLNLVRPDKGEAEIFGCNFYDNEAHCKQRMDVVFGEIDFYKHKRLSEIR